MITAEARERLIDALARLLVTDLHRHPDATLEDAASTSSIPLGAPRVHSQLERCAIPQERA